MLKFTLILPRRLVSIPSASNPIFFVKGLLPVLTRTTSASNVDFSPPFAGSNDNWTFPSARIFVSVT